MLLPTAQFSAIQSPILKVNVLTDPSLLGGPFVPASLVEVQMILPILSKKTVNTVHLALDLFYCYLPES